ncbi:hypothetical protein GGR56DRAFT_698130 [Xylariaceae sp. FL0804]|nr:hypothetical protein GGR56DRAFT_698130 [Xylariaceae sp. FL0804]
MPTAPVEMSGFWRGSVPRDGLGSRDLMLDRIQEGVEGTDYTTSRSHLQSRDTKHTGAWPFHHRNTSEVASTMKSIRFAKFRPANWTPPSIFRQRDADAVSIDASIVPDYVINFMRGETPETLARKKERKNWGERGVEVTDKPYRGSLASHLVEFGYFGSSSTANLHRGINGDGSEGSRKHLIGWRGGILSNIFLSVLTLVVGIICLILVLTRTNASSGGTAIYSGSCTKANHVNIGIHAVINVFTVALLAGANYAFQVLSSPTRPELSEAHDKKRWLDIGIPSLRNLTHISPYRAVIATVVVLGAVATQVIYNAVIYTSSSTSQTCTVYANGLLLGIAALLNLLMVVAFVLVFTLTSFKPLATLGDAIRSFLQVPDSNTMGACLLTKADVRRGRWGGGEPRSFTARNHYWIQTPSPARWCLTIFSWLAVFVPAVAALALMIQASRDGSLSPFGRASSDNTFELPPSSSSSSSSLSTTTPYSTTQVAVIAALPQLLLAVLYLTTNSLLTTYFLSQECALFALGPRCLRVSAGPRAAQTTSLYLTLPRPVSWLLLLVFAALGLVLSQALFPAATAAAAAGTTTSTAISAVSLSSAALLALAALLAALLVAVVLGLGLRLTPAAAVALPSSASASGGPSKKDRSGRPSALRGNPLALPGGACSAVLAARCHGHVGRCEGELWLGPVGFGVVREEALADGGGRGGGQQQAATCGFTAGTMGSVDAAGVYA